jgi:hypothetical protein
MPALVFTEEDINAIVEGLRGFLMTRLGQPMDIQSHMQAGIKETTDESKDTYRKYEYNGCARMALQIVVNPPYKSDDNVAWMVMHRCATCGNPWTGK